MGTGLQDGVATYQLAIDDQPADGVFVFDNDLRHVVVDGALPALDTSGARLEGLTLADALPADACRQVEPRYRAALAGVRSTFDLDHAGHTFLVTVGPVRDPDHESVVAGLAYWRDVSDERRVDAQSWEAGEQFRTAFEHAPIGMAIVGLDGRYHEVNQAFCDITGHTAWELRRRTYHDLTHPDDLGAHQSEVDRLLAGEISTLQGEKRYLDPAGNPVWVLASASLVRGDGGRPRCVILQVLDIDERKQREAHLLWQAERDGLTGLWNRHRFDQELLRRKGLLERHGEVTAVILLDLDDFKDINDTFGHGAGDAVLRRVADVLGTNVRTPDIAARYGGDEFAVVLPHTSSERATRLAERLVGILAHQPVVVDGQRITVSASAGVADNTSGLDPLVAADRALYTAKRARGVH